MKNEYLEFAKETARSAGQLLRKSYGNAGATKVIEKEEKGLLTEADLLSDKYIREAIKSNYPQHSIVTEEGGRIEGNEYEWVVDPIDETNNFRRGLPQCTVSIGLRRNGKGIVGAIYAPVLDELYYASKGKGAYLEHDGEVKRIQVSGPDSIKMFTFSRAVTVDLFEPEKFDKVWASIRKAGLFKTMRARMFEGTAYELCCVADGRFDAHFNNHAQPWDIAAGEVIVKEAGGKFTYIGEEIILASNGVIHDGLVSTIETSLKEDV